MVYIGGAPHFHSSLDAWGSIHQTKLVGMKLMLMFLYLFGFLHTGLDWTGLRGEHVDIWIVWRWRESFVTSSPLFDVQW